MIRWPAEWEPQAAVLFSFPNSTGNWGGQLLAASQEIAELIAITAQFVKVIVVCGDPNWAANYSELLAAAKLVEIPTNDCWIRDFGPLSVEASASIKLLDYRFNGWGRKYPAQQDDRVTARLWAKRELGPNHLQCLDTVLEGGSIETDGRGTILTTTSCLLHPQRNPALSKQRIEQLLKNQLGASRVVWLDHGHLIGDDTDGHIDTLVRFCDPKTIAYVACDDRSDLHYGPLQKMQAELKQAFPEHQLVPLPFVPALYHPENGRRLPATYANFLISNGVVLLPTYGVSTDKAAIKVLESLFPEREIVPLSSRAIIHQNGSFHCLSMQLPLSIGGVSSLQLP
ncbi:MAG: agmatine deiminase family protein [Bacteroidota bacterium]